MEVQTNRLPLLNINIYSFWFDFLLDKIILIYKYFLLAPLSLIKAAVKTPKIG